MWNKYYFKTYSYVVSRMIGKKRGTLLDVGTSHGYWLQFWRSKQFDPVLGLELDPQRAKLAKRAGYDEVYRCDAAEIPLSSNSVDVAVSNDVFVHILELEHKIAVLEEIERLLKTGGIAVINHPMSRAYGFEGYRKRGSCSFLDLHEFITLVTNNTNLRITDIKPTYYHFRSYRPTLITRLTRSLIAVPLVPDLLFTLDYVYSRNLSLEESDAAYLRLRKVGH